MTNHFNVIKIIATKKSYDQMDVKRTLTMEKSKTMNRRYNSDF